MDRHGWALGRWVTDGTRSMGCHRGDCCAGGAPAPRGPVPRVVGGAGVVTGGGPGTLGVMGLSGSVTARP